MKVYEYYPFPGEEIAFDELGRTVIKAKYFYEHSLCSKTLQIVDDTQIPRFYEMTKAMMKILAKLSKETTLNQEDRVLFVNGLWAGVEELPKYVPLSAEIEDIADFMGWLERGEASAS